MPDFETYLLFVTTAVVIVLSPGPDTVLILSRTVASGAQAGLMTLLGTQAGNVIHAVLAGIGVSTVLLLFPTAFAALKIVGVLYLLYLAVVAWRATAVLDLDSELRPAGHWRYFVQGLVNNVANPKMGVFFLALFPQFVRPDAGSLALQSLVLGLTLALMALIWIGALVLLAGRFRSALAARAGFAKAANRLAALVFVGLAIRLAFERDR